MLHWGVLGTGRIAQKVVSLIQNSQNNSFIGVASRSADRSAEFASSHKIKMHFGNYDKLLHHPEVDAIYITIPNTAHAEWAQKALHAGKHVLCEKPLAMSLAEITELQKVAASQKKHLAEGFMYRHHEQTANILKLIHSNEFGKTLHVHGDFHFQLSDTNNIRLQKAEGGGALRDVGCYLINFITAIFNEEPLRINATGVINGDGVDTQASSFFTYSAGRSASFTCSFSAPRRNSLEIICEKAHLLVDNPFKPEFSSGVTIITPTEIVTRHWADKHNSFMNQFNNFHDVVTSTQAPTVTLQQSCLNHKVLDGIINQLT